MDEINYDLLKQKSILFVDDDRQTVEAIQKKLNSKFGTAYFAYDGQEGLELFNKYKPDIIISDIEMPLLNGIELLKYVKKAATNTLFFIISGYTQESVDAKDADAFFVKPFYTKEVFAKITSIYQNKQ
jgi:DNA-binding response OmpR family regulator